jgi:quercetin dioxygenase-like cupin family protein
MDDIAEPEAHVHYIYDFAKRLPQGATSLAVAADETGKSSTVGAVLTGRSIACTLEHQLAGTGAKAQSHPHEQFSYILQGTMMSDIEGDRVFASRGSILHTPGAVVQTALACPDEDLVIFAIRDRRQGIVGAEVDGVRDAATYLPGFGDRSHEPRASTAEVMARSKDGPPGPGKRYVYDMRNVRDNGGVPASAEIIPDSALRLPPGVTGKLLTGERLHVCVLRLDPGAKISNYRRDNEQIVFAAEGELQVTLEQDSLPLPQYCVLHIPPAMRHELVAPYGAVIVIAQDKDVTP